MKSKNTPEGQPQVGSDAWFGPLREFLAKHGADEKEWDAIDRAQAWSESAHKAVIGGAALCDNLLHNNMRLKPSKNGSLPLLLLIRESAMDAASLWPNAEDQATAKGKL